MNLYDGARLDERFHVESFQPYMTAFGWDWLYRRVHWVMEAGYFNTYILLWFIRWYRGTAKCDGSRTFAWRADGHTADYVITTTPKEMFSIRLRYSKPDREVWYNMGGI